MERSVVYLWFPFHSKNIYAFLGIYLWYIYRLSMSIYKSNSGFPWRRCYPGYWWFGRSRSICWQISDQFSSTCWQISNQFSSTCWQISDRADIDKSADQWSVIEQIGTNYLISDRRYSRYRLMSWLVIVERAELALGYIFQLIRDRWKNRYVQNQLSYVNQPNRYLLRRVYWKSAIGLLFSCWLY